MRSNYALKEGWGYLNSKNQKKKPVRWIKKTCKRLKN